MFNRMILDCQRRETGGKPLQNCSGWVNFTEGVKLPAFPLRRDRQDGAFGRLGRDKEELRV